MRWGIISTITMLPIEALSHYQIGTPLRIKKITNGFVHSSFKVETTDGVFLLQKLHHKLGTPAYTKSYVAISHALSRAGFISQRVMKNKKGRCHIPDEKSGWRLVTFVPGKVITGVPTPAQATTLASALGKTHLALKKFPARNCSPMKMHQTRKIYSELQRVVRRFSHSALLKPVAMQTSFIKNILPTLFLPSSLPLHTIHGDTKINNFVLLKSGSATMIDLDTCTHASPLLDLGEVFGGDALAGSWCRGHLPVDFNTIIFASALVGYRNAAPRMLSAKEQKFIVQATKLIAMELAARFLIDYFNDSYFGWDPIRYSSRRAHNLARVNAQIAFYKKIVALEPQLQKIVQNVFTT